MALEDFTTYDETDPDNVITVGANSLSFNDFRGRFTTSHIADDKGVNHFSGDFEHKFEIEFSDSTKLALTGHWMVANSYAVDKDLADMISGGEDCQIFHYYHADDVPLVYNLTLQIIEDGSQDVDTWVSPVASTRYFIRVNRDDDGGANNTGQINVYIATDNYDDEGGTLKDTLTRDCGVGKQNDFRYIYPLYSYDTDNNVSNDGYTENLDLQEEAPPVGNAGIMTPNTGFWGPTF